MSGVRVGTRLDHLQDLRRQITIQLEHARRNSTPTTRLHQLAEAVDDQIRAEGGTPPPPPGHVTTPGPKRPARAPHRTDDLLAELGTTTAEVRAWAVAVGILRPGRRGRISAALVEAYARDRHAGLPHETGTP
ncbi:MAG TPA: hypothetical protein VGE43_08505 [Acidimicrobiales bacterium]